MDIHIERRAQTQLSLHSTILVCLAIIVLVLIYICITLERKKIKFCVYKDMTCIYNSRKILMHLPYMSHYEPQKKSKSPKTMTRTPCLMDPLLTCRILKTGCFLCKNPSMQFSSKEARWKLLLQTCVLVG